MLQIVLFILVVIFAVLVQAVAGFGGTLIAMPVGILLVGVATAKPVMTIIALVTGAAVAIPNRKHIDRRELLRMTIVMLAGVAAGLWLFGSVSLRYLLLLYAVVVLIIGIRRFFAVKSPDPPAPLLWTALGLAGVMQGLFVSGGSFLAIYSVARIKDPKVFRATINAVWVPLNICLIASYAVNGTLNTKVLGISAICLIPTCLTVAAAGALAKRLNRQVFLKIAYLILIASGAVLLISNL